jgi:tetratricopeptide (TPR) repeat protein
MVVRSYISAVISFLSAFPAFCQPAATRQQQIETHARQAQQFLQSNKPELAAGEFAALLKLDPNNIDARGNFGVLLFFQGDYKRATPELRAALKARPTLWKIQALLGMSEKRVGDIAGARGDLETSFPKLEEEKLRIEVGMELIEIYYQAGELDKAAGAAGVLKQLKPGDVDIQYTAHRIYSDLADETMLSIAMLAPGSARMHQLMAHQMARQGNAEGAIAHYREALKIAPRTPGLHFEIAEMLNASSVVTDQEEAQGEYKKALSDNPFDEKAECRLGEIAARQSDLKNALAHYSRALELQPGDAAANLGLARTWTLLKQPEKAGPYLEKAVQLEPFNAVTHYRLSLIYRDMGRSAEARRELEEFKRLKDMKDRLKQVYHEMRLQPAGAAQADSDEPK